jgi:hypothetical protein
MIMNRLTGSLIAAVLILSSAAAALPSPLQAQGGFPLPCETCDTEALGFARCVDASFGTEGYRRCFTAGSSECTLDIECVGDTSEAHRVTPSGRVGFEMAIFVAFDENAPRTDFRPVRSSSCSGIIFRLEYTREKVQSRMLEQTRITI